MEAKIKPIPAFYCCYLLRSTVRHASLYVGSSPNPARRLNQHNGNAKGGAVRTSRTSLRPWEMTCIVAGFPSNIAALQFEWAWQNAHLTRHIAQDERLSFPVTKIKTNSKTGKTRRKPGRPPSSLIEKLSNLHLLLRTRYFSKWPLELRFFNEDIYRAWKSWSERVDAQVRPGIPVILDLPQTPQPVAPESEFSSAQRPAKRRKVDLIGKGGVEGVDPTYARYQDVFEKARFLLDDEDEHKCEVCRERIDVKNDVFTMCTVDKCSSLSHATCLSSHFLSHTDQGPLVPDRGKCPGCQQEVTWFDLMRAVSLRMRGEKEVQKLLKKKRSTKAATAAQLIEEDESSDGGEEEELTCVDVVDEDERDAVDNDHDDDCDDDNDDILTVASIDSFDSAVTETKSPARKTAADARLEIVIEDSEEER